MDKNNHNIKNLPKLNNPHNNYNSKLYHKELRIFRQIMIIAIKEILNNYCPLQQKHHKHL